MNNIANFIFEMETLKNLKRSGSSYARIPNPDSVAEHIAIAAQVAFILAGLEGADMEKCACMILFHDNAEVRVGDINKVQARYLDTKEAEKKAHVDQVKDLPPEIQIMLQKYFIEFDEQKTKEAKICKDADLLELAFQAKIFLEQGYEAKVDWLDNIETMLKTRSAKELFATLKETDSTSWWRGLKKL